MECLGKSRVVYFTVQQRDQCEAAHFRTDTPADEVKGQQNHHANALRHSRWGIILKHIWFFSPDDEIINGSLYEERGREYRSTDTVLMTGQGTHDSG
jgi:hypothetical protein